MNHQSAAETYLRDSLENAPPIKIIRLLYQGALRFLDQAMAEDAQDPQGRFFDLVWRVEAIVTELRIALDDRHNPEVAKQLRELYLFAEDQLGNAVLERSATRLPGVRDVLTRLLDGWNHVELVTGEAA